MPAYRITVTVKALETTEGQMTTSRSIIDATIIDAYRPLYDNLMAATDNGDVGPEHD